MKNQKLSLLIFIIFLSKYTFGQVGISATPGYVPDSKAMLDISSTTKGLLIPRMTTAQRNAIIPTPTSLMVFDTDVKSYWFFDGTTWKEIGAGGASSPNAWNLIGNSILDPATQFVGTTNSNALNFKTDNEQRMQIGKSGQVGIGVDYDENNHLFINSTKEENGIYSQITYPQDGSTGHSSFAIKGINSSLHYGELIGGYFESNGYNGMTTGDNIGIKAIAKNGSTNNIGLFASTSSSSSGDLAGFFDKGHVKINNTLAIGTHPTTSHMFHILKPSTKNAGYIDIPVIGKNNNIYFGKNVVGGSDVIGLEINMENTPTNRALEVHGRSTFYDKVGINTTYVPAAYSLAVNGFIIATELRIQNRASWPDYVFDQKYKLKPLAEVSDFIQKNKHLPEVPSAKVVENEGIVIGEMQITLLKKIEELTLYIIDQQKQIDELKTKFEKNNQK